jgi:hypothetical protein
MFKLFALGLLISVNSFATTGKYNMIAVQGSYERTEEDTKFRLDVLRGAFPEHMTIKNFWQFVDSDYTPFRVTLHSVSPYIRLSQFYQCHIDNDLSQGLQMGDDEIFVAGLSCVPARDDYKRRGRALDWKRRGFVLTKNAACVGEQSETASCKLWVYDVKDKKPTILGAFERKQDFSSYRKR